jgi:hypothetical protein
MDKQEILTSLGQGQSEGESSHSGGLRKLAAGYLVLPLFIYRPDCYGVIPRPDIHTFRKAAAAKRGANLEQRTNTKPPTTLSSPSH